MDHTKAPIYDALIKHRNLQSASFHVPGHKSGAGLDQQAAESYTAIMSIDLTELTGLDDLHQPEGAIRDAERLAAHCYGARHTCFLVGGSTVGNLAAILSMCRKGHNDLFIVQRNVHKSIIHGLMLARAEVVFLAPQVDAVTGIAAGVNLHDLKAVLQRYPDIAGVILTNPNYYGMGTNLHTFIDCIHQYHIPVLIDEAHGAHYGFHPSLPQAALSAGADVVVQSTHKMLTAMTMGAMLHLQGNRIDPLIVRRNLSIVQSSSPSYPILASLDLSRRFIQLHGHQFIEQALTSVDRLRHAMDHMPWFQQVKHESSNNAYTTLDPLKLTIGDGTGTLGGFELQHQLEQQRCYPEMADPNYVVLAFSLATTEQDIDRLLLALQAITTDNQLDKKIIIHAQTQHTFGFPAISDPISFSIQMRTDQTAQSDAQSQSQSQTQAPSHSQDLIIELPIEEAVDLITIHAITPYPPGIPLLFPGERVSTYALEQLQLWRQSGARIHGLTDQGRILVYRR